MLTVTKINQKKIADDIASQVISFRLVEREQQDFLQIIPRPTTKIYLMIRIATMVVNCCNDYVNDNWDRLLIYLRMDSTWCSLDFSQLFPFGNHAVIPVRCCWSPQTELPNKQEQMDWSYWSPTQNLKMSNADSRWMCDIRAIYTRKNKTRPK